ncbi:hypothetical protein [Kitasatospora terrestris]|uniref:NlpC/P60 domain-containing protein n=1 Tax=Kitasatospora terrestris TaxID=258051 RepID=A0ABP9D977_9ACTN
MPSASSKIARFALAAAITASGAIATTTFTATAAHAASSVGGQITRSEVIARAQYWYGQNLIYDQGGSAPDSSGTMYRTDCGGYVDMAWHLAGGSNGPNTDGLVAYSTEIARSDLKPGDILDSPAHVVLFDHWDDSNHTTFSYYSFGSTPLKHVSGASFNDDMLSSHKMSTYTARRYNKIVDSASSVGVFRPSNATFYLSNGGYASFGANGDVPLSGDWNGDGKDTFGVYRPSDQKFYLTDNNSTAVKQPKYGNPGDVPLVGDWNGDGVDSIGVYRPSDQTFYLTNDDNATEVYHVKLGVLGDKPIVGDWNGDGKDTVGIYRPSDQTFAMTDSTTGGTTTTHNFKYGNPGDAPIKGDWDGDGRDEVGVYRAQYSDFIEATFDGGGVYSSPRYGVNGDIPVIGQW